MSARHVSTRTRRVLARRVLARTVLARTVLARTVLVLPAMTMAAAAFVAEPARAATVTASYASGHLDVVVNGYGTDGLGMFLLDTGDAEERSWCIEAHVAHTRRTDAYAEVASTLASPELDALVWWLARRPRIDDDTATAGAALIWYYAGATRSIGPPVWSDGARSFAPITPLEPEPWDALTPLTLGHPVGLRAGGVDLDAAERRVAELHRWAVAHRGPWDLRAGSRPGAFVVAGPAGPIVGAEVVITVSAPDRPDRVETVRTDADGVADVAVGPTPDGARVAARVESPGRHRAWDGPGDVQRLVTATNRTLTAHADVPPLTRHVEIAKTSSDPTFAPAGAAFELHDASGRVIDRGVTDDAGRLAFAPIDPSRHPAPYTIVETVPPPGLLVAEPVSISDASTDPGAPTVVEVVDHPVEVPVVIRKRLSVAGVGPPDRSGFGFSIVRAAGGVEHHVTTGPDGRTGPVGLPFGTYEICETSGPDWAVELVDTGCRSVEIDASSIASEEVSVVEFDYLNEVPTPLVDTNAADRVDGDQVMSTAGGPAVDHVRLTRLVPGTRYRLVAHLVGRTGEPTGVQGELVIDAVATAIDVELHLDVPPLAPGEYVIVERLEVVADDEVVVVARHDDLADRDQTLTVVAPSTNSTTTTSLPPSTVPSTSTSTTTTTPTTTTSTVPTATTTSTTTSTTRPIPTVPASTLPRTGSDEALATALRVGDLAFVAGVALTALAGVRPRRRV